ncbi:14766_t:CDS:10 [Cetraspora pellucida]|uniref:14766_t:CDS:1 n=1 Tax=Cetraspora pellucida TaxID=1433469 RepID=A0ACA9KTY0_9GLOM|nr:14766_t:CDS:10 [Cetraspora pellucida]
MDNLDFFDVDNDFGMNNNKSFMSVDMNYNESFMSVDMNDNEISGDFYNNEGMDDNNESELGDHEEHEENTRFAYPLVKSQVFESWKAVDYWLERHGQELGFAFSITHSENNKSDETSQQHVYTYTKGQRYVPCKEAHILGERDQDHKTIGCSFHMIQNITMVESRYRRLTKKMQDDVRLLASCGVRAGSIIEVLQQKNSEKYIHARNGEKWGEFFREFCHTRNSRVESIFEKHWGDLIQKSFNASVQTTQRVESYNGIIKKHVNGSSSLFESSNTIERLLIKKDRYQHFNEVKGVLPVIHNKNYCDRYFKLVDESCQKFLTVAILKIQRCEMNRSIHYRAQLVNLVDEFQCQIVNEVSTGMFANDMFDAFVIELEELISDLDHELCEKEIDVANQPAISAIYNNNFGSFEHRKGFGIIKKVLDLSIATGRYEELYEIHLDLMKEMKMELKTDNNHNNFITMINNPVGIHSKGSAIQVNHNDTLNTYRKQMQDITNQESLESRSRHCGTCGQIGHNACTCNLDGSINQMDSTQGNYVENSSLSSMADKDLNHENTLRHCRICGQSGHNARICNSDSKNKLSNNIVGDYSIDQENINSVENSDLISIVDKNSIVNRLCHCGAFEQAGHNTRTCDSKI